MKILCIEDDEGLAKLLQQALIRQHYQVELATDGQKGWNLTETIAYDLVLLDWMLPKLTGIEFCRRLRTDPEAVLNPNRNTPILLMTALDAVTNKVMSLNAGADDYVVKPFDLDELLARIRALLRRAQAHRSPLLQWEGLCLNPNNCEVTYQQQPIALAAKEYELLELFLRNPDQIFSLNRLLVNLWATEEMPSEGAVRAHIKGLRQKLKRAGADDPIETLYKLGYRLKPPKTTSNLENRDALSGNVLPQAAPAFPISSSPILPELQEVWQACRQSYCDRLSIIQHAVTAQQNGTLTVEQQHEAEREAHTLIGSLGSFGLDEASRIARQIQQILKHSEPIAPQDIKPLVRLIAALQQHLAGPKPELEKVPQAAPPLPAEPPRLPLLLIDNDLAWTQALAKEALSWEAPVEVATTVQEAQCFLQKSRVGAILVNPECFASPECAPEFWAVRQSYPHIPVALVTAKDNMEQRLAAIRLGCQRFIAKPVAPFQVLATVTQLLQQTQPPIARVLIVDRDPASQPLFRTLLEPDGYHVTVLNDPQQFWPTLEQTAPDLLILDIEPGEPLISDDASFQTSPVSSIELCQMIRHDLYWNRLPILFLSAHADPETVQRSFAAGGDDVLGKPVVAQELLTRIRTHLNRHYQWTIAELDELTGVSVRQKVQQDLTHFIQCASRQQQPLSLALFNLDNLRLIQDEYGPEMGDRVLRYVGQHLHQSCPQDRVGRWGDEAFIVSLYGMTKQESSRQFEDLLHRFNQHEFLTPDGRSMRVTVSMGIAQFPDEGNEWQTLYHVAQQALNWEPSTGSQTTQYQNCTDENCTDENFTDGNFTDGNFTDITAPPASQDPLTATVDSPHQEPAS